MEQEGGMKVKMKRQTMLRITLILFFLTVAITFWVDWRIGLACKNPVRIKAMENS